MKVYECFLLGLVMLCTTQCKKIVTEQEHIDRVTYEVDGGKVYLSSADKVNVKSSLQFISVLYGQIFKRGITIDELMELDALAESMGDKQMYYEILMGAMLKDTEAQLWTETFMQENPEDFVEQLFLTFLNRMPDAYEMHEFTSRVADGYTLTDFYWGILLSNEYNYY